MYSMRAKVPAALRAIVGQSEICKSPNTKEYETAVMLRHDMRTPLDAVLLTASHLAASNAGAEVSDAAATVVRSGAAMKALLDDLGDFNRTKLGIGILSTRSKRSSVTVRVTGGEAAVEFEVSNQGPAMAASEEIFNPLQSGSLDDERESSSLGLGLDIVREIVQAHGGKVEMRSAQGETVFAAYLPRDTAG